jgi:hypothetical protein
MTSRLDRRLGDERHAILVNRDPQTGALAAVFAALVSAYELRLDTMAGTKAAAAPLRMKSRRSVAGAAFLLSAMELSSE